MPTITEVIKKAESYIDYSIMKYASKQSIETKEDIKQSAFERVLKVYPKIDGEHWKAYIQTHCNGAVLDYLKSKKNQQVDYEIDDNTEMIECDSMLNYGIFYDSKDEIKLNINWDLVSRMAGKDDRVLLVARFILGYTISDVSTNSTMSRSGLNSKLNDFIEMIDDPFRIGDRWVEQVIYAFGLSKYFHQKAVDNGEGWDLEPINIFAKDLTLKKNVYSNQLDLL